eukprot:TRINITY_DN68453_c0_g1_i1.p1 TRINITY_DN68453_c0_g1~~TRINITY_DN68453_c0_g1_i1.p1  ORF type:complete len:612 (-),score=64.18 TRINITY_DN68453_c0_g1_i1:140-1855(-)
MAPAASKSVPPPPTSPQEAAALAESMLRRVSDSLFALFQSSVSAGEALANQVTERVDRVLRGTYTMFESCSWLFSLSKCLNGRKIGPLVETLSMLFVLLLIAMLYSAFVFCYLPAAGLALNSPQSIGFHAIVVLLLSSFRRAASTDPGRVPEKPEWRRFGCPPPNVTECRDGSGEARWCAKCECYKPDRAHNCSVGGRCVLRMDHFCPWLGNTIGHFNHKYFILLLFYTNTACGTLGFSIIHLLLTHAVNPLLKFLLVGSGLLSSELMLILFPFFVFQLFLIAQNRTTVEFRVACNNGKSSSPSCYDIGLYGNVAQVMGDNPLLWAIPVGGPSGDGLSFPTTAPPLPKREHKRIRIQKFNSASISAEDGTLQWAQNEVEDAHGRLSQTGVAEGDRCGFDEGKDEHALSANTKKAKTPTKELDTGAGGPMWTYGSNLSASCQALWDSAAVSVGQVKSICFPDGKKKRMSLRKSTAGLRARAPAITNELKRPLSKKRSTKRSSVDSEERALDASLQLQVSSEIERHSISNLGPSCCSDAEQTIASMETSLAISLSTQDQCSDRGWSSETSIVC